MATATMTQSLTRPNAANIPALGREEARTLAMTAFERILTVVENLSGDDWEQQTECTEWNVKDMVAHLSGSCAGFASWEGHLRQTFRNPYLGKISPMIDAINAIQVDDRANYTPEELIAEFREVAPKAINTRHKIPWLLRIIPLPNVVVPGKVVPVSYLLDIIYSRDEWMHRADLCRASGQKMILTEDHDARIVELILRDIAVMNLKNPKYTVDLVLTGDISLAYRFGNGTAPEATLTMDIIEFNRRSSERTTVEDAIASAHIQGEPTAARWFFENCAVTY